jgi:hypothetical protein
VEADLRRFYGVRLSDLWRRDSDGHRLLTLREVWVYVSKLPRTSALAIDDNGGTVPWSLTDFLIADLWELQANAGRKKGSPPREHAGRKKQRDKHTAQRASKKKDAFERAKARDARRRGRTDS